MSSDLEQNLRDALAARAAELPPDATTMLLAGPYRPRSSGLRTALALTAVTLACAAALAISLTGIGTDTPRAFAGWSAAPTAAVRDQVGKARTACRSRLANQHHVEDSRFPVPRVSAGGWHAVLVDTRGPFTTIVFEAGHGRAVAACFDGSRQQVSLGEALGVRAPAPVPPGQISYESSGGNTTPANEGSHQFSRVIGRTGAGVTAVTLRLNDGTRVRASCVGGWFLAWWPGSHGLTATEVTTAAGTRVQ
jgi:hypothetical protein